jgi:hypothetical protein
MSLQFVSVYRSTDFGGLSKVPVPTFASFVIVGWHFFVVDAEATERPTVTPTAARARLRKATFGTSRLLECTPCIGTSLVV